VKRYIGIFSATVLALFIAFGSGCSLLPTEEELLPPKLVSAAALNYTTVTVEKGTIINEIAGDAVFRTYDTVNAAFTVDGTVYSRDVEINQKVSKGDLIAVLAENADYKLQLSTKQREVNSLKIEMDTAYENSQGGGEVALLKLALEQEEYNLSVIQGGGTLSDGTTLEGQQLKVQIAQQTYDNAIATAENTYVVSKANYDLALEELAAIQAKYDACFLYAPITGICTWTNSVQPGKTIAANADFATFTPAKSIVLAYSSIKDISEFVEVGTEFNVTFNGTDYVGTVTQTPQTQPAGAMYNVKYMYFLNVKGIDMADANLLGQSVAINLVLDSREDTFVVDTTQLSYDNGVYYLNLLVDGLPILTEVTLGISNDTQTEILSGLSVGDQIIIG